MRTNASIYAQEPVITPERKVWRAVLGLAYEDAELALFSDGTEPEERVRARAFLRADSVHDVEWLRAACQCAEIPFDRVVKWARKRYPHPDLI